MSAASLHTARRRSAALLRELVAAGVNHYLPGRLTTEALEQTLWADEDVANAPVDLYQETHGHVITVFGAKGGIGKITVSTNLGALLAAEAGVSVLLMDMDTRFGDAGLILDVEPRPTVTDLARTVATLERQESRNALVYHESGLAVLPAPASIEQWGAITPEQMHDLIIYATRLFDYVILDTRGCSMTSSIWQSAPPTRSS